MALMLFALLGGIIVILRFRALDRRVIALERSLGAFAALGGGDGGTSVNDEQILQHLLEINEGLLGELKSSNRQLLVSRESKES